MTTGALHDSAGSFITLSIRVRGGDKEVASLAEEIAQCMEDVYYMRKWDFVWKFDNTTNNIRDHFTV